ncbi:MAG: hypothetical protein LBJ72_06585 [Dysgonamonadaceae bacterium]|nr:hypothetical protein [Dysgonamonadaceae bacterium]
MKTNGIRKAFFVAMVMMVTGIFSEKAVYWYDDSGNVLSYFMSKKNINIFEEFTLANQLRLKTK